VYFSYPDPADPHGAVSPLQAMAGAVDSDEAITTSRISMFRRGIHPSHAVIVGKNPHPDVPAGVRPRLTGAQERQIIGAIRKRYGGATRHGEPLILDGLIEDVKRLSNTPAEMDFLNSGKDTKSRIVQGFGTNPIVMGEVEGANRASASVAELHFCANTLNPKIVLISQCLTEWLAPMFGEGLTVWIEPCVPHDAEMSHRWATLLVKASAVTGDELRRISPFDLAEDKQFEAPVSPHGHDREIAEATRSLSKAVASLERPYDRFLPKRIAERIHAHVEGNGRH
jgi:phage portal protein BeeE